MMTKAILLVLLAILLAVHLVEGAASDSPTYTQGQDAVITTTEGAITLTIRSGDQVYRFLGPPEQTITFHPSTPGEYLIQETLKDGAVIESTFTVFAGEEIPVMPDAGAPYVEQAPMAQDAQNQVTSGIIEGFTSTTKMDVQTLERDERTLSAINPGIRIKTGRGTGIVAAYRVRQEDGTLLRGSTGDLGARLPVNGKAEVTFDLTDRHATSITLRGVDLSSPIDLGVDDISEGSIAAPVKDRAWTTVYAVDPTSISFTDGELRAIATGTELYKCRTWDFEQRACPGAWEKIADIVPGQEYVVPLSPVDPGFAESVVQTGYDGSVAPTDISLGASVPGPIETGANEWGVTVLNPTNRTIDITRVLLTASANIFGGATGVRPSTTWSSAANRVNWSGSVVLGPEDAAEFVVNVQGVSSNLANVIIELNITTNDTNLSARGYDTYTRNAAIQSPSVYLLNSSNNAAYAAKNLSPDEVEGFIVTVDNGAGAAAVALGTSLVIYLPPEWKNVSAAAQTGWSVGTVMGDEGSGWALVPQVATTTIAAGGLRNFTFSAIPPDRDTTGVYRGYAMLLGPASNSNIAVSSTLVAGLVVRNLTTRLLDSDDDRYAVTRTAGGARGVDQYLGVPAPIDSPSSNLWGVAVVNPTDDPINVTQIDIQTSSNVFSAVTAQHPAVTWSLVSANNVRWNGTVTIPPRSARSFAVNVTATATSTLLTTVTYTTVTSAGTLTTTGLITSMSTGNIQHPSLFAMNSTGPTYAVNGFTPGQQGEIRLRVSNKGSSASISTGTALEIYTPPGWVNLTAAAQTGWTILYIRSDPQGGGLLRALVASSTIGTGASRDFRFNITPPYVGTNSTYRFEARLVGETGQTTSQIMDSVLQLAVTVVPTSYGISFNRTSQQIAGVANVSTLIISDIVKANKSTAFNLSVLNTRTGVFDTLRAATLGTSEEDWNATWGINRTFDPRDYINSSAGTVRIKWTTTSENVTALYEDMLTVNVTYDTTPPMVSLTTPADLSYSNTSSVYLAYLANDSTDLRNCSLFLNGTYNTTNTSSSNSTVNQFQVSLAQGVWRWSIGCSDLNGHTNRTINRTITIDTTPPSVWLNSPPNRSNHTSPIITFNITPTDTNIANCTLIIDGIANQTNTTPASAQPVLFTASLPDGNSTWTASCTDLAGNTFTNATRIIHVDSTPPRWSGLGVVPGSGAYDAMAFYQFNATWTDASGVSLVLFESNFTGTFTNQTVSVTNGTAYAFNTTGLAAGSYSWRFYANDTFGNWNATNAQAYTVIRANSSLSLFLNGTEANYPVDVNESVNITLFLVVPVTGYLEIYVNGTRYATGTTLVQNLTRFSAEGTYNVTGVYNQTQNYTQSAVSYRITVGDKTGPRINQTYPADQGYVSTTSIVFIFNVTDATGVANCSLSINSSLNATNATEMVNGGENTITASAFAEGTYRSQIWCYDTVGNLRNSTNSTFIVDLTLPAPFTLLSPENGTTSQDDTPTLYWNASSDAHFANYTILIDNAADFATPNYVYNTTAINITVPDALLTDTVWHWKAVAYDLAGNARNPVPFVYRVDTTPPRLSIVRPQNQTYVNTSAVNITFWFTDFSTVVNCTVLFNDSTSYSNTSMNQTGNTSIIPAKGEGSYLWSLVCTDIAGNTNATIDQTLIVDLTPPTPVTLLTPLNNTFSNNNTPTLTWTQTIEQNFKNYTVLVSDTSSFPHINHSYEVTSISTPTYDVPGWGDGTWYWKVIAYDLADNSVDPFFMYTIDATPPTSFDLLDPPDGTSSTDTTPTLTWQQSNDTNFANYTVLVTDDPSFSTIDHTYRITNNTNTTFEVVSAWADNTIWYWRVVAWDNATNSRNSTSTFTYITDSQAPVVSQVFPSDAYVYASNTSSLLQFVYNVTDLSDISSCTLTINQSGSVTTQDAFFISKAVNQTFTQSLGNGAYNWSVLCIDDAGNTGSAGPRSLTVNVTLPRVRLYDNAPTDAPQLATSQNRSAIAVYESTDGSGSSVPKYRQWNGTAWGAEGELPTAGSAIRWVKLAASPKQATSSEMIAVTVSDDGNLDAYTWNGTAWTAWNDVGSIGTTSNADRAFDIEYETQRGRAMLVYSVDSTNASRDLAYRIWNGSGWEVERYIDDTTSGADLRVGYIRIARDPENSSNELAIAFIDTTNADGEALIWNGSSWGNGATITGTIAITTEEDVGIAYESRRNGILAVAGQGTVVAYSYHNGNTWNQTGTVDVNPSAAGTPNFLTLKPNTDGNEIMLMLIDSGNDLSTASWADQAWTGAVRHDASIDTDNQRSADFAWEYAGSSGLLVWGTTAGQLDYRAYSVLSSWAGPNFVTSGTNTHPWVVLRSVSEPAPTDSPILGMSSEATALDVGSIRWTGATPLVAAATTFTSSGSAITYQRFDMAIAQYARASTDGRNISLNRSIDANNHISLSGSGLALVSNATSAMLGNLSARGLYLPTGSSITFSNVMEAMNPGITYLTWRAYKVNATGEYLLCQRGNLTRGSQDIAVSATSSTTYSQSCSVNQTHLLSTADTVRVYTYANSSSVNLLTKRVDDLSSYIEFEGYLLGDLAVTVASPVSDPLIGEGENLTFICQVACTDGYCLNVNAYHMINTSLTQFNETGYFTGNIILNASTSNPVIIGTTNATSNATFNLTGNIYSLNNTLMCSATSDFINATSNLQNVTVLDKIAPNVTLDDPTDAGGYDPGLFTFSFTAGDRRIANCTLWGNWSGTWARNQTLMPNNYTSTSFSPINISAYGTYLWNVNCTDLGGNDAFAPENHTFTIAGDLYIESADIVFSPASPVEEDNLTILATIHNRANRDEASFNVSFWLGDPDAGGTQIGSNITVPSLAALQNVTVNTSMVATTGNITITVIADDPYGSGVIFESSETNNRASNWVLITLWQLFYGNATGNVTLDTAENGTFVRWMVFNNSGIIYIADTDTTNGITFNALRPLGRNVTGGSGPTAQDDFSEADTLLGTDESPDNINTTFTYAGAPIATRSFTIYGTAVSDIPIINSSANGNFTTGALWDADDSTNAYYDIADQEDLVFITEVQASKLGARGFVDYEMRIPSYLKTYKGTTGTVTFYYEIA